ncbi:MAG: hypothetical protein HZB16_05895 [Armatimonadetes bacterium]|nr:hypothetical protein [Armatimonadota bacterium]
MITRRPTLIALLLSLLTTTLACGQPATLDAEALKTRLPRNAKKLAEKKDYAVVVIGAEPAATWPKELGRRLIAATGDDKVTVTVAATGACAAEDAAALLDRHVVPAKPDLAVVMLGETDAVQGRTVEAYLEAQQWLVGQLGGRCGADVVLCQPRLGRDRPGDIAELGQWLGVLATRKSLPLAATAEAADDAAVAQAVLDALAPPKPAPLSVGAVLRWTAGGPRARLTVKNVSDAARSGRLSLLPRSGETFDQTEPLAYRLEPQATVEFDVGWLGCESGARLLAYPHSRLLSGGRAMLTIVDTVDTVRRLYGVESHFQPEAYWLRNDGEVASESRLRVSIEAGGRTQAREISWPEDSDVGRVRLLEPAVDREGGLGWAATELYYLRFAGAPNGETSVDGLLKEWASARWSTLSDPAQVCARPGVTAAVPSLRWAARAGKRGVGVAINGRGSLRDDRFSLAFDPRTMALLGTVGRTYWLDGTLRPDGTVALTPGPTVTGEVKGLTGAWRATEQGLDVELFVPFSLMSETQWPEEQDLGFALIWQHGDTALNWSGDNSWLSPREYGVLHRLATAHETLPWAVRVR